MNRRDKQLQALLALTFLLLSIAARCWAAPSAASSLSIAEQQQLVASSRTQLDEWAGNSEVLRVVRDDLSRVIAANPRNADARVQMARCHLFSAHRIYGVYDDSVLERAGQELSVAYKLAPASPDVLLAFASLSNLRRQPEQAQKFLDQAMSAGADPLTIDLLRAHAYMLQSKWREAQESISTAETRESKIGGAKRMALVRLFQLKGDLNMELRQLGKAEEAYRKITLVAPDYAWGHGNYAEVMLLWRADAGTAIREASRAIEIMDYPAARFTLGAAQYVQWANLPRQSSPESEAQLRLARRNAPDADAVMAQVAGHVGAGPPLEKLVRTLLLRGVSIDARDARNKGSTALTLAVDRGDGKSIDWLLAHNADVNARGIYDRTALFLAVERDNVVLVKKLIARKADVNLGGVGGETPLMAAAGEGNSRMAAILLDAGADSAVLMNGQDAAAIAAFNGHADVARQIRAHKKTQRFAN